MFDYESLGVCTHCIVSNKAIARNCFSSFHFFLDDDDPTDKNTVVFKLSVKCDKNARGVKEETKSSSSEPYTHNVYSGDLEWIPQGNQQERCKIIKPGPRVL